MVVALLEGGLGTQDHASSIFLNPMRLKNTTFLETWKARIKTTTTTKPPPNLLFFFVGKKIEIWGKFETYALVIFVAPFSHLKSLS